MIRRAKVGLFVSMVAVVASLFGTAFPAIVQAADPAKITAADIQAATVRVIDRAHIEVKAGSETIIFFDKNISDATFEYVAQDYACDAKINLTGNGATSARLDIDIYPTATATKCNDIPGNTVSKTVTDGGNLTIAYAQTAADTISRVDGNASWTFRLREGRPQDRFYRSSEDGKECQDVIIVTGTTMTIFELDPEKGSSSPAILGDPGCKMLDGSAAGLKSNTPVPLAPLGSDSSNNTINTGGSGVSTGNREPSCETVANNPLSWILCPVFNGVASLTEWILHSFIQPFLYTSPISTDPDSASFKAWSSFRVYGNIFLILAILVIVFGQAIGGGLIDAYTAKKVLPRILTAAVMINLSIYIVAILVDITNALGAGITQIIYAPIKDSLWLNLSIGDSMLAFGAGLLGVVLGGATLAGFIGAAFFGGLGTVAVFIGLTIVVPMLLAMVGVFATLVIRKGLLLFLIMVSPVAFALYCLPNTEKYFKKWWELLVKTLLVYPIVMTIFALSGLMSVMLLQANGIESPDAVGQLAGAAEGFVTVVAAFLLQIVPLFLVPFAFKFAGGSIATLYGAITGVSKKGYSGIMGQANDPNSLRNKTRRDMNSKLLDAQTNFGGSLNRPGRTRFTRGVGRLMGSPAMLAQRQATKNAEEEQALSVGWNSGNDMYLKASTLTPGALDNMRGTDRHRAATADRPEQWMAADGSWFDEATIREGNRQFGSEAAKQFNFKKLLEKTEPLDTESQDRVFDDYLQWANTTDMTPEAAGGRWQGVSIPLKTMRLDLRRVGIRRDAATGRLERGRLNQVGLMTEYANLPMHAQVQQTPGTFAELSESIRSTSNVNMAAPPEVQAEQAQRATVARNAYANLRKYVIGAEGGGAALSAEQQAAVAAQLGGNGAQTGAAAGYSSSSSAAAKNAEAARAALSEIETAAAQNPSLAYVLGIPAQPREPQQPPTEGFS